MGKEQVSIIISCYNLGRFLSDAIESVRSQTYGSWECIVVNDGSDDDTEQVALKYSQTDERIRYIYQDNKGVAAARNNGIRNSHGEFILLLDADDKLAAEFIEKTLSVFVNDSHVKLVYTEVVLFGEAKGIFKQPAYSFSQLLLSNMIVCTALLRKIDFDKTNGFDETLINLEDWEFWISFLSPNDKVVKLKENLFFYRIKPSSRNKQANNNVYNDVRPKIFKKHIDKYIDAFGDYFFIQDKMIQIVRSKEYRLGSFILKPIRKLVAMTRRI